MTSALPPLFSIILPTYNRSVWLSKAINSVLSQSFHDWELIIIDDGSTDNTEETVKAIKDKRIRYFFQENIGRGGVRNTGINEANGLYITFLDDDDYYLPGHLSTFNEIIRHANYPIGLIRTEAFLENTEGLRIPLPTCPTNHREAISFIWRRGAAPVFFAIHKDVFQNIRFNKRFLYAQDLHLLIRAILHFPIYFTNAATAVVVEHSNRSSNLLSRQALKQFLDSRIAVNLDLIQDHGSMLRTYLSGKQLNYRFYIDYKIAAYKARRTNRYILMISLLIKALYYRLK